MFVHLIWLPSWSVLQTSRPIRGLGDTGSSEVCRGIVSIFIVTMLMILHQITHLWFWRDVEAKKTRVSVVVAALLVLVDLLLKHSQSSTEHTTVIIQMRVFHLPNHHHRVSLFVNCLLFRLLVHTLNQQMIVIIRIETLCRKMMIFLVSFL